MPGSDALQWCHLWCHCQHQLFWCAVCFSSNSYDLTNHDCCYQPFSSQTWSCHIFITSVSHKFDNWFLFGFSVSFSYLIIVIFFARSVYHCHYILFQPVKTHDLLISLQCVGQTGIFKIVLKHLLWLPQSSSVVGMHNLTYQYQYLGFAYRPVPRTGLIVELLNCIPHRVKDTEGISLT